MFTLIRLSGGRCARLPESRAAAAVSGSRNFNPLRQLTAAAVPAGTCHPRRLCLYAFHPRTTQSAWPQKPGRPGWGEPHIFLNIQTWGEDFWWRMVEEMNGAVRNSDGQQLVCLHILYCSMCVCVCVSSFFFFYNFTSSFESAAGGDEEGRKGNVIKFWQYEREEGEKSNFKESRSPHLVDYIKCEWKAIKNISLELKLYFYKLRQPRQIAVVILINQLRVWIKPFKISQRCVFEFWAFYRLLEKFLFLFTPLFSPLSSITVSKRKKKERKKKIRRFNSCGF